MLNILWSGMILLGIAVGIATGNLDAVGEAAIESSKEAVNLCITMTGVMSLWMGIMKIGECSGLMKSMEKKISPVLHWLFPEIPKGHPALQYIATNFIANIFGLGWAATPAGLKAMEELQKLEDDRTVKTDGNRKATEKEIYKKVHRNQKERIASNEMCTFLVLNISSLQLIPVNVIAYRSQYGSVNPAGIIGPAIVATLVSTVVALVFCKVMCGKR